MNTTMALMTQISTLLKDSHNAMKNVSCQPSLSFLAGPRGWSRERAPECVAMESLFYSPTSVLSMSHSRFALIAGLAAEGAVILGLIVSILIPNRRFWPPGERSWAFGLYWLCGIVMTACGAVVGYLDRDSLGIDFPGRISLGSIVAASGVAIGVRASRDLNIAETTGLEGRLYTDRIYRYTRNPQYVGILSALGGFSLLTNSVRFVILAVGGAIWTLLLPFVEEPWLEEQYGGEYETYRERVPRFLGWETLVQLGRRE